MSFDDYMNNRKSAFDKLTENLKKETTNQNSGGKDDRIWKPQMGKDGTGYAVVRFLPGADSNKTPWVRMYDHGFQGPSGKWYIENSLTTIGKQDPVSEHNSKLWNSGLESNKEIARKQKRRTSYYANVLVLKDPADPSSEGKVKMYRFGQKIFDKIMGAMQPEFADDEALNPFDLMEGANFRIKLKTVAGYWNYDSSEFEKSAPLSEDMEKMKSVFDAQHDIHELIAEDKFKSYEELEAKLMSVIGETPVQTDTPAPAAPVPTAETSTTATTGSEFGEVFKSESVSTSSTDEDDLEDYFKNLAND